jgi:hypothetical protein
MSNIKKMKIQIEKHDFWAMFKHGLPYKSYVKRYNKGWLQKWSQMKSTIYLNRKVVMTHERTL